MDTVLFPPSSTLPCSIKFHTHSNNCLSFNPQKVSYFRKTCLIPSCFAGELFNGKPAAAAGVNSVSDLSGGEFFVSDAEGDPDRPTDGYSSIEQAINTLRQKKFVIVVDDENGDVEGNIIMAASFASPKDMAFMVKHGSGIVSVGMTEEDLVRLKLPLMSPEMEDADSSAPTFTITVDAKIGTTTGVSAVDRAKTVLALSSPESKPGDFRRPGHVFPLKYRNGGVLRRAGHTEASVDLVMQAGLYPVSVLSAIVDEDDGNMASLPYLRKLALEYSILIVSITDLIRYRSKREKLVERIALTQVPTKWDKPLDHRSNVLTGETVDFTSFISQPSIHPQSDRSLSRNGLNNDNSVIDELVKGRPLPQKGRLLEAVMEAGPLLQTLLIAGSLPSWRNPPPLQSISIPPVSVKVAEIASALVHQKPLHTLASMTPFQELSCSSSQLVSASTFNHTGTRLGPSHLVDRQLVPPVLKFSDRSGFSKRQRLL